MLLWILALLAVLPLGWAIGLLAAALLAPGDVGQLPAFTIPAGFVVALLLAVLPIGTVALRLKAMLGLTVLLWAAVVVLF